MKNNQILIILALLLLVIPISSAAVDVEYIFKINEQAELKVACFDTDSTLCTNSTDCYVTVHDPDGINIVNKKNMTFGAA